MPARIAILVTNYMMLRAESDSDEDPSTVLQLLRTSANESASSWFFVGASSGSMSLPWLIGQLFGRIGPQVTIVVVFVDLVLATAVFVAGYMMLQLQYTT